MAQEHCQVVHDGEGAGDATHSAQEPGGEVVCDPFEAGVGLLIKFDRGAAGGDLVRQGAGKRMVAMPSGCQTRAVDPWSRVAGEVLGKVAEDEGGPSSRRAPMHDQTARIFVRLAAWKTVSARVHRSGSSGSRTPAAPCPRTPVVSPTAHTAPGYALSRTPSSSRASTQSMSYVMVSLRRAIPSVRVMTFMERHGPRRDRSLGSGISRVGCRVRLGSVQSPRADNARSSRDPPAAGRATVRRRYAAGRGHGPGRQRGRSRWQRRRPRGLR